MSLFLWKPQIYTIPAKTHRFNYRTYIYTTRIISCRPSPISAPTKSKQPKVTHIIRQTITAQSQLTRALVKVLNSLKRARTSSHVTRTRNNNKKKHHHLRVFFFSRKHTYVHLLAYIYVIHLRGTIFALPRARARVAAWLMYHVESLAEQHCARDSL